MIQLETGQFGLLMFTLGLMVGILATVFVMSVINKDENGQVAASKEEK